MRLRGRALFLVASQLLLTLVLLEVGLRLLRPRHAGLQRLLYEPRSQTGFEDARTLAVTAWDKTMVAVIEKAILSSDLGLNPNTAGNVIRIPLPPLTEERRMELGKVVHHEGENAKIAIRNIRRDANHHIKDLLKEKEISEDDDRRAEQEIQNITDANITKVDEIVAEKEQELLEI